MKKKFMCVVAVATAMLVACQSDEPQVSGGSKDDAKVMNGKLRTIDEAAEIAQQGIAMIEGPAASRFGSRRWCYSTCLSLGHGMPRPYSLGAVFGESVRPRHAAA